MRSISAVQRPDSGLPDPERPSRKAACPNTENRFCNGEIAEFLSLFNTLDNANHVLLSYVDEVVASIRAPGAQQFIDVIAVEAENIRDRMSLMAKLAAELKDTPD